MFYEMRNLSHNIKKKAGHKTECKAFHYAKEIYMWMGKS